MPTSKVQNEGSCRKTKQLYVTNTVNKDTSEFGIKLHAFQVKGM